jgi:carbon-monoxide dehydrogenase large subunit
MIFETPKGEAVKSFICPDPLPDGPYGAKGMSESIVSATGPAIAAALYQAVGVRLNYYPMTAEKVLAAIKANEGGE